MFNWGTEEWSFASTQVAVLAVGHLVLLLGKQLCSKRGGRPRRCDVERQNSILVLSDGRD